MAASRLPTVFVSTSYIGAGDIDFMHSTVDTSGNYELSIIFKLGTDLDNAAVRVQNKISSIMSDLPAEVQSQGVTVEKNTPEMVFMFHLISPNGSYDGVFMKNSAKIYLLDKIQRVEGVGKITSYDGDYSMHIWLNPDRLAELGLTVADVESAIKEQNVQAAVGSLGKMPTNNFQEREFAGRSIFLAVTILIFVTICAAGLNKILPSEYVPEEDKGNFFVAVNLPEGSSMNRTIETLNKFFFSLKELFAMGSGSLPGMESAGAISMKLLDVKNHSDAELAALAKKIELAANERDEFEGVTENFSVSKPYVDIFVDEDKAKFLGVNLDDIYTTLRVNFSGEEINDFTSFGRVYKVILQAETNFRDSIDAAKFLFVMNKNGESVPLDTFVTLTKTTGAAQISGYNCVRCVSFDGNVGEGFSTGQALDALEEVVEEVAPNTFQIEWAEKSRQEKLAQSSVAQIFALSLIFVFLCLVALYESWKIPFAVLLSVPTGIFGALLAEILTGNLASIYMQIGILVLIALVAKNLRGRRA